MVLDDSKMDELGFSFKSWAYSGIGKGLSVAVNIATKEVTVTAQPEQEEEEEEMEEEDAIVPEEGLHYNLRR